MPNNQVYKKGERICCIGGGLHIECVVIEESNEWNDVKVLDPIIEKSGFLGIRLIMINNILEIRL